MNIYKVVARYGLDTELDSRICLTEDKAREIAKEWLEDEDCDDVAIYLEKPDWEIGIFKTYRTIARINKPI